jgi:hypothetical protein
MEDENMQAPDAFIPCASRGKQLAGDHWSYVERTLMTHGVQIGSDIMRVSRFHYTQAFEHGYKHGCEDMLMRDYSECDHGEHDCQCGFD